MFYSFGARLVKIQSQFLLRESVVYVILGVLGVIFIVEWLVMIKQWCHILCVAPLKKNMKWMNSIELDKTNQQNDELGRLRWYFHDCFSLFSFPFSTLMAKNAPLPCKMYFFFLMRTTQIPEAFLRLLCRFCIEVTVFCIAVE